MKTIFKILPVVLLGMFICGCASDKPAYTKTNDPRMEAPADPDNGTQTEVHGYISTSVGTRIK